MEMNLRVWMIILYLLIAAPVSADFKLHVLDVGEGQSVLLQDHRNGILIDTGSFFAASHVLDYLKQKRVRKLDHIIFTHLHPDHASGFIRIREAFPKTPVQDPCHPIDANNPNDWSDAVRWTQLALEQDQDRNCIAKGQQIDWHNIQITTLWPDKPEGKNLNRHSVVLLIEAYDQKILLMGDADQVVEQKLISDWKKIGPVDLLIVGHHGAQDASSPLFLQIVQPRLAAISVNPQNARGYPAAQTLQHLEQVGAKVLRTDVQGDLCWRISAKASTMTPC